MKLSPKYSQDPVHKLQYKWNGFIAAESGKGLYKLQWQTGQDPAGHKSLLKKKTKKQKT